jgi:hypothetical protein
MAYADKREGKLTGSFVGEAPKLGKKRRFKTLQDAKDYETFCKLMGREPPTIDEGMDSTGAPTFAQVVEMAKKAGGPDGKWKAGRDRSLMQRLDYCVGIIGPYEIQRVGPRCCARSPRASSVRRLQVSATSSATPPRTDTSPLRAPC